MPVSIDQGDRTLLVVAGGLLVVLILLSAFLAGPRHESSGPGFPTSYSTAAGGAKAAYLLLGDLGWKVERWVDPPSELPAEPSEAILVLADPFVPASAEERQAIMAFVRRGGRVLATGISGADLLSQHRLASAPQSTPDAQRFAAEVPAPLTSEAPEIEMNARTRWSSRSPGQQRYYGDADGATVVGYRVGKGEVIWWADSLPLTNYGLTQSSNLMLLLNSLRPNPALAAPARVSGSDSVAEPDSTAASVRTRILWDEYYHGERPGFWAYMGRTPAPWALLQIGVIAIAALLAYGRRSGPVRSLPEESRLSPLEFVETLGALYQRHGAAREALEINYARFRTLLIRRLRLGENASADEIISGVRDRLGWSVPGFRETLRQCERGVRRTGLKDREALDLVQNLYDYSRRFRLEQGSGS